MMLQKIFYSLLGKVIVKNSAWNGIVMDIELDTEEVSFYRNKRTSVRINE